MVLKEEKENRNDGYLIMASGRFRLLKTWDPESTPDWHALPFEQAIPLRSI
tara:strand:+ start:339 stop:491 length:153 start_codon:yes stop_codon:yes gene_type:complete